MASYDGEIRINTAINTSSSDRQLRTLGNSIERSAQRVQTLTAEMRQLANTRVPTDTYVALQNNQTNSTKKLNQLNERMTKWTELGRSTNSNTFKSMQYDAQKLQEIIARTTEQMRQMNTNGTAYQSGANTQRYQYLQRQLASANQEMNRFRQQHQEIERHQNTINSNVKRIGTSMNSVKVGLNKIVSIVGRFVTIFAFINIGKQAIKLASDIQEVDNVVSKSFGSMRDEMDALAESAIKNLGMSRLSAYKTGSAFMSMGKSTLSSMTYAKDMALELTKLSANMSSFFNTTQDLTSIALKSIYTGETETLKQYGVVMAEVNLQEYAMTQGINKKISAMTQSEKVMLRYQYVMNQLSYIGDDFVDTQETWANQTRILSEQWKELLSVLGSGLVTVLTPVVKALNSIVAALINVANTIGKVMSSVFGIQAQQLSAVAGSADSAADSMTDYGDATEEAGKQASGALAKFDDLDVLQQDSSSGSGGSGASTGIEDAIQIDDKTIEGDTENAIDGMISKMKPLLEYIGALKDLFLKGFREIWDGLDMSERIKVIIESFKNIGKIIAEIFTDIDVQEAAKRFVERFCYYLGQEIAAILSIGASIIDLIIGSIESSLEENREDIHQWFIKMFDITGDIEEIKANFLTALANIFTVLETEAAHKLGGHIITMFTDAVMFASETVAKLGRDLLNIFTKSIIDNQDGIKEALEGVTSMFEQIFGSMSEVMDSTFGRLTRLYDEHFAPFFDDVANDISVLTSHIVDGFNEHIKPLLDDFASAVGNLMLFVDPIVDSISDFFGTVLDGTTEVRNAFMPFVEEIIDGIFPAIAENMQGVIDGINNLVAFIHLIQIAVAVLFRIVVMSFASAYKQIVSKVQLIKKFLSDLILFIQNTFTDLWNKAFNDLAASFTLIWDGICDTVKGAVNIIIGVINSMIGAVESAINSIIDGINVLIEKAVNLANNVPGFDFEVRTIDNVKFGRVAQLANGGITTGETLARIGEAGREAVIPLENNLGYLDEFADRIVSRMPAGGGTVVLEMDGKEMARGQMPYIDQETRRIGVRLQFT